MKGENEFIALSRLINKITQLALLVLNIINFHIVSIYHTNHTHV